MCDKTLSFRCSVCKSLENQLVSLYFLPNEHAVLFGLTTSYPVCSFVNLLQSVTVVRLVERHVVRDALCSLRLEVTWNVVSSPGVFRSFTNSRVQSASERETVCVARYKIIHRLLLLSLIMIKVSIAWSVVEQFLLIILSWCGDLSRGTDAESWIFYRLASFWRSAMWFTS